MIYKYTYDIDMIYNIYIYTRKCSNFLRTLDCPMSLYLTYVHWGAWSSFYGMKPWVSTPGFWYSYKVIVVACSWISRYTGVHRILQALDAYCDGPLKIKGKGRHCAAPIAVTSESVPPYGRRLGLFGYKSGGSDMRGVQNKLWCFGIFFCESPIVLHGLVQSGIWHDHFKTTVMNANHRCSCSFMHWYARCVVFWLVFCL